MSTHVFPDGEEDRHFPCAGCHCEPWERSTVDDQGDTVWHWFHETLGDRRQRRLVDGSRLT